LLDGASISEVAGETEMKEIGAAEWPTPEWHLMQEMSLPLWTPTIDDVSSA
jgi:hypothetical protein